MTRTAWVCTGGIALSLGAAFWGGCTINSTSGTSNDNTGGNATSASQGNGAGTTTGDGGGYGGNYTSVGVGGNPASVGSGPLPTDCTANSADDSCTACSKQQCCNEITKCTADKDCPTAYQTFNDCLYPSGVWSGYDTHYCKVATGADDGTLAGDMISCFTDGAKCGTDQYCGAEVNDTWNDFAAGFVEHYCAGCHHPNYVSNGGISASSDGSTNIHVYTDDMSWANDGTDAADLQAGGKMNWLQLMNKPAVVADNELFWCGLVAPTDPMPMECDQFVWSQADASESGSVVTAGAKRFPKTARFPPTGGVSTDHLGGTLHCWWTDSADVSNPTTDCQNPSDEERHRFISWIFNDNP